MIPVFASLENRRRLLFRLQKAGLQARMHSYEYFIRKKRFVRISVLSSTRSLATIYQVRWNKTEAKEAIDEVSKSLKEVDSTIGIECVS